MFNRAKSCFHHVDREPVARCPECSRYFCRECVSDHDGRLLCSDCLLALTNQQEEQQQARIKKLLPPLQLIFGLLAAWLAFYFVANSLLSLPATIHDGTIWHEQTTR